MKKWKMIALVGVPVAAALTALLVFLSSTGVGEVGTSEQIYNFAASRTLTTEKGFYYTDINNEKQTWPVVFFDFDSKQQAEVCNRPNCTHDFHQNKDCDAYFGSGGIIDTFASYGSQVYALEHLGLESTFHRCEPDFSNKTKVVTVQGLVTAFTFHNNVLYYSGYEEPEDVAGTESRRYFLSGYNLQTGEMTEPIYEGENDMTLSLIDETFLGYAVYEEAPNVDFTDPDAVFGKILFHEYHFENGLDEVFLETEWSFGNEIFFGGGKVYYRPVENGKRSEQIIEYDVKTKTKTSLPKEIGMMTGVFDHKLFYGLDTDNQFHYYDFESKEICQIRVSTGDYETRFAIAGESGEGFVVSAGVVNAQPSYLYIEKEAFYTPDFYDNPSLYTIISPREPKEDKPIDAPDTRESLVWVTQYFPQERLDAVNALLADRGFSHKIEVVALDIMNMYEGYPAGEPSAFDNLESRKKDGAQTDILTIGSYQNGAGSAFSKPYYEAYTRGLLTSWDQYLNSEAGKPLYDAYHPLLWESVTLNGSIFGLRNDFNLGVTPGWLMSSTCARRNGISAADVEGKELWELEEILKTAHAQQPQDTPDFAALRLVDTDMVIALPFDMLTNTVGVRYDDGEAKAVNIFEDETTIRSLTALQKYRKAGYLGADDLDTQTTLPKTESSFLLRYAFIGTPHSQKVLEENTYYQNGTGEQALMPVEFAAYAPAYARSFTNNITGAASWSAQPEKVFELLTLIANDPELANLIKFGIRGVDYYAEDGYAVYENDFGEVEKCFGTHFVPNSFSTFSGAHDAPDKSVDYDQYVSGLIPSPILGFALDTAGLTDEITATDAVYQKYFSLFSGKSEQPARDALTQMNKELREAGIEKILEEANRQIAQWKAGA